MSFLPERGLTWSRRDVFENAKLGTHGSRSLRSPKESSLGSNLLMCSASFCISESSMAMPESGLTTPPRFGPDFAFRYPRFTSSSWADGQTRLLPCLLLLFYRHGIQASI